MNDQTRATGTAVAVQLPSDARELMSLAKDISTSRLIPTHFQKSPADCWMLMAFCRDKGLNFFSTVGHCHIVKNNLFFDGQLCGALLNISGFLADRLNFDYERDKNGVATAVTVSARLVNEAIPRTVRVELANVKTANAVWEKQPEQQLGYSGTRIWGRRHLPEVLLGMTFEGETIDVTPSEIRKHELPALKPAAEKPAQPAHSEGPVPFEIVREDNSAEAWSKWGQTLMAYIRACSTVDAINDWLIANSNGLGDLKQYDTEKFDLLFKAINKQLDSRVTEDDPGNDH